MAPLPTFTARTGIHAGSRYTTVRVTVGGFTPGLIRKVFCHDYQQTWTGGPFKPVPREPLLSFAERLQANIVVNADGYATTGDDFGLITGLQLKDGVLYSDFSLTPKGRHALGILPSGEFRIYDRDAGATAVSVQADGVTDTFTYGPPLVVDGVPQDLAAQFPETEWAGPFLITSRTILGQTSAGDVVIICVEGERPTSAGLGGNDLVGLAVQEGCRQALILDGGGSTQLAVNGRTVVESSDPIGARDLGSVVAISAVPADGGAGRVVIPVDDVQVPAGVTLTAPYFSVIEVPGARLLSIKAAFTAASGALWDGELLATFPPSCRGPAGSNWQYAVAHVATATPTNGVGGICYRTSSGELRISKDILPTHYPGVRWDVTMLIDISPQTPY